ncbi:MAG: hypothetical protein NVSMB27_38950 [Ktedonobacteraceae bacterium]
MNVLLLVILFVISVGLFHDTDWYRQHGRRVVATVTSMHELIMPINPPLEGQNLGWRIIAEWTDPETQKTYKFKGTAVHQFTHYKLGDDIYVLIDPNNMKHYHLEVD